MTAPPLSLMLTAARAELAAETPIRLHTSHAPKLLDADGVTSHYPDEGGLGLPFTAQFHRLLSEAPEFVMRGSLRHVSEWCTLRHPTHVREHGAPLCAEMTDLAVRGWFEPDAIAALFGVRPPLVRDILTGALAEAAEWRANERKRINAVEVNEQERTKARQSETIEDRLSAEHDLAHQERAWLAYRRKYDRIPEWADELARRREHHKALKCPGCPLLAEAA